MPGQRRRRALPIGWRQALYGDSRERDARPKWGILAFDDAGTAPSAVADWVLNPVAPARPDLPGCLFGPLHVPLRREIRRAAAAVQPVTARPAILVTFGGSDPAGLSLPVAAALIKGLEGAVPIDVVLGGAVAGADAVAAGLQALGDRVFVHRDVRDMGALMLRAGLAVSAGGGTIGELAALAVPSVIATIADNQLASAASSADSGWCVVLDGRAPGAPEQIAEISQGLWRDPERRQVMADRAQGRVAPDGAIRIAKALIAGPIRQGTVIRY
jgi:spore coat polysaccharide biosynthesis predicted glycosyltransferase SpsG